MNPIETKFYITWKVQQVNRLTREKTSTWLILDTSQFDSVTRYQLELASESRPQNLPFIKSFREKFQNWDCDTNRLAQGGNCRSVNLDFRSLNHPYYEDEGHKELTLREYLSITAPDAYMKTETGDELPVDDSVMLDSGDLGRYLFKDHVIPDDYPACMTFSAEEFHTLDCFCKDIAELFNNRLYQNPPRLFGSSSNGVKSVQTIGIEYIQAYVMVFRRIFLPSEPGNFKNACEVFTSKYFNRKVNDFISNWLCRYNAYLEQKPTFAPNNYDFTTNDLINLFLNSRFAHNAILAQQGRKVYKEQYFTHLGKIPNKDEAHLEFLFYYTILACSSYYQSAAQLIIDEFDRWCQATGTTRSRPLLNSPCGHGSAIPLSNFNVNLFDAKANELAYALWKEQGSPSNIEDFKVHEHFVLQARTELAKCCLCPQ